MTRWDQAPADDGPEPANADWLPAVVPGVIQYDLVRAGRLENPFGGTEAAREAAWVAESDWVYATDFDAPDLESAPRWGLHFDGIDTFAEVWLNGQLLGRTGNAYRNYDFELESSRLTPTGNRLVVRLRNHASGVADKIPEARERLRVTDGIEGRTGKALIRRYQRSFFTGSSLLNVGTSVLGIGIHRPVSLVPLPAATITDLFVKTVDVADGTATLDARVAITRTAPGTAVRARVRLMSPDDPDTVVADAVAEVPAGDGPTDVHLRLEVPDAKLWWPRGYGEAVLHEARATIESGDVVVDAVRQPVGIKTVELREELPSGRATFEFVVNGVPVHVRGTNYIPVDYLKVHGDEGAYRRVFELLVNGNNNLLRMWGGGAVESDSFYDECDRLGIMIWQDFYLHSNVYPDYDPEFVAEFAAESREMVHQLRRHAGLVLLCGGNEQREGWDEWGWRDTMDRFYGEKLITETIPAIVAELDSGIPYIDNSPHGGSTSQSPLAGEGHIWGSFFNSTKDPLFVTETCWGQESYSRPETLAEVMGLDVDEFAGLGWAERWQARTHLGLFIRMPFTDYHSEGGLREYLAALEVEQGMADYFALSNFRLRSSSNRGIVYWSFNKGGPLFQFGAVDYRLRPLMSHYVVARLYAQTVVGAYRDNDTVRVIVSNRSRRAVAGELEIVHVRTDGTVIKRWHQSVEVAEDTNAEVLSLDGYYREVIDRSTEVILARLSIDGEPVSEDLLLLCPLAELRTPRSEVAVEVARAGAGIWDLTLSVAGVSKLTQIDGADDLVMSDNFLPLVAGYPRTVRVTATDSSGAAARTLRVHSLDGREVTEVVLD
ncbi:glycoside hydrolase family 2 protein [Pseudolysinimonas kribbensis]|uniref:glycoside hydrolase family 2 protein n=1 Tax=Pseudolysinimonas kribbensis TaxID=433641 RepID=UPI0024E12C09|nr:glycoside hydrolase family 2 protein [Pseudolysinimonas kribbensis]